MDDFYEEDIYESQHSFRGNRRHENWEGDSCESFEQRGRNRDQSRFDNGRNRRNFDFIDRREDITERRENISNSRGNLRDRREAFGDGREEVRDALDILYDDLYDETDVVDSRSEDGRNNWMMDREVKNWDTESRENRGLDMDRVTRQSPVMNRERGESWLDTDRGGSIRRQREIDSGFRDRQDRIDRREDFEMGRNRRERRDRRRRQGQGREGRQSRRQLSRDRSPHSSLGSRGLSRDRAAHSRERSVNSRDGSVRSHNKSPRREVSKSKSLTKDEPWVKFKSVYPTVCVLITGLPNDTEENDIHPLLHPFHAKVKDVRITHSSGRGGSEAYGFVDFVTKTDAQKWMDKTDKRLEIKGKSIKLYYSVPKQRPVWHRKRDQGWTKWATEIPSSNIVIWNLDLHLEAKQIEEALLETTSNLSCCKVIRSVGTGESRGFGFLEFVDQASAEKWFNESKGMIMISEKPIFATFSSGQQDPRKPWRCKKCGTENFKQREVCFICGLSKKDSEKILSTDGIEEIGTNPCNTLIFQGLDALSTEETINNALYWATGKSCRQVIVMRDPVTKVSMSYAFGELTSVQGAKEVMAKLSSKLEVDGKQVTVSFTKNTFNTIVTTYTDTGHQPLYPVSFALDESNENQMEDTVAMETEKSLDVQVLLDVGQTDDDKVTRPAAKEFKRGRKRKKSPSDGENPSPGVDPLSLNLQEMNCYLFDPATETYYDNITQIKCPVPNCKVKAKWQMLRRHWQRIHIPTKNGFLCQYGPCRKKKLVHKSMPIFRKHLKSHSDLNEKYHEEQIKKAKLKPLPNNLFQDPGSTAMPTPRKLDGPKIDLPTMKCPVNSCPHSYTTMENMKQHWAQYHNPKVAMYRCCECDTINRDKNLMLNHMKKKHAESKSDLEKVELDSKQFVDPGNIVPFWSLYREDGDEYLFEEENEKLLEQKLGDDFPLVSIPFPGNDPEDLCEFISWTQRYMNRLQVVHKDAVRDLKKLAKRKAEK